ncbi:MAG TPA: alpha/beta hydrolase, partial [Chitinophagales bacterium]|nr:alpha/beta hydrolase [Chitinophagales bacterium]
MLKIYALLFALVFAINFSASAQCSNGRYRDKIFDAQTSTVTFGNAMKFDSTFVDLKMDIYQPTGDQFAHRPLIMLAFGGSFTAGFRQSPDIVYLCNEFTKRGYVCASIDYRLGFEGGSDSDTNQFKALMRGVQDMKAAVRYLYKDAQTSNAYRIDTNQIFIGGVSAGAFIGLNYAYGKEDTLSRISPPWAYPTLAALGGSEGNSGSPGYSTKVKGVIDLCGGIADTVWIMPNDPILVGVHGTADDLVACYYDSVYALTHPESLLFGGGDVNNRAGHIGLNYSFKLFQGAGHVPFILPCFLPQLSPCKEYMDTTENL